MLSVKYLFMMYIVQVLFPQLVILEFHHLLVLKLILTNNLLQPTDLLECVFLSINVFNNQNLFY